MSASAHLNCVAPNWPVSAKVTVFTTTRHGGVSAPPFDTLNLGLHVGDNPEAVIENRRRLQERCSLPSEPVWLNQTHGTRIVHVTRDGCDNVDADGAFTCATNIVLAVLTADCLPVVISDAQGTQVAVVHAGWRGLAGGILTQAVTRFKKDSELYAWLGPAIGPARFEVGEDVRKAYIHRSAANTQHFADGATKGKYWADLYALARSELTNEGCETLGGEYCTHTRADLFHSHRRDGKASGRMATLAWISAG